ncbi:MAG: Nodulation protein nolO [Myxococcaceae bacterium]|nr:Nodulation protein nolO [Myxococcaceae bacterium]
MAAVLGISAYYHDAAAALVVDGRIVAAMQEERFSRIKNDASLPAQAARACLRLGGLAPGDLDAVVYYEDPFAKLERVLVWLLRNFPRSYSQFPRAMAEQLGSKLWVLDGIAEAVGVDRAKVTSSDHHKCHAASAFFTSPFESAAILTVDGVGEHATTTIWKGEGKELTALAHIDFPHSLGLLYGALTAYLGFEVNEGEYKVMGLAAFGTPRFKDEFRSLLTLRDDGSFELGLPFFAYDTGSNVGFAPKMEKLLGPRRPIGRAWDLENDASDRRYADIAATLQAVTEDALLSLAREARRRTESDALCLAGGVALNAVANARLLRDAGFGRVAVHPAAGDAGGALGAAILGALERGDPRPASLASAALGEDIDVAAADSLARALGLTPERVADPAATAAEHLQRGAIVAVCEGRFEWGPRALGQRSLLALPSDPKVRERLNRVIKRREPFRPFAPAVPADRASTWFDDAPSDLTPFMTTVCRVRDDAKERLAAVTHVDGSARVQTVTSASAPFLDEVLAAVGKGSGVPIVLNTSLNGPGEPIVASATDALGFFVGYPVDAMLIGDLLLVRKRESEP